MAAIPRGLSTRGGRLRSQCAHQAHDIAIIQPHGLAIDDLDNARRVGQFRLACVNPAWNHHTQKQRQPAWVLKGHHRDGPSDWA